MERFIVQNIAETLEVNYMPYAMSVIVSRAIPEIDGFKPSHRKLLYTMYKMNLIKGTRTKSANVVGQTMKLNPHGDMAIYATLVRLTKGNESLLYPYIDSKGNFGKVSSRDMKFAAARYTEVKLDNICQEIFKNIDKNTVQFQDNYDGKMKEPVLLPVTFPNILLNPNKGIAVGMASNIPSFNMDEIIDSTIKVIDNPGADLIDLIKGPDFPTGGYYIYDRSVINKVIEKGQGSFKIRSKYEYNKKENCIEITEIPYTATIEQIIEKIVDLVKSNKAKEISDVRDETDKSGLKLTIDLKRGTDPDKLMTKLFKATQLEDNFPCNFNILINGRPRVMGIREVLNEWIKFRIGCIENALKYDLNKIGERLHLLYGMKKVLLDIDKAIEIIRFTEYDKDVIPNLIDYFEIDKAQAEFIAEIKLRNVNKEYILNRISEIESLEGDKEDITKKLSDDKEIRKIIKSQLKKIKKDYSRERMTQIVEKTDITEFDHSEHIEDYPCTFFITKENYIKKITPLSLRGNDVHRLKENDSIKHEYELSNDSEVIVFTDRRNVYKLKTHTFAECKASSIGMYLPNLIEMEEGENILHVVVTKDFSGHILFAFDNGKVAKVPLSSYYTKNNRKKLKNGFTDKQNIIDIFFTKEDVEVMFTRESGSEIRILAISSSLIPEKATKTTLGVQVVRMKKDSRVTRAFLKGGIEVDFEKYIASKIPVSGKEIDPLDNLVLIKSEI
ncbi:MAG: topoisomerase IV [Firmicutes bacterium]|jgi:DNA gyrase subunit A|nr:topoisomerase IV [Bacillota bacterium]